MRLTIAMATRQFLEWTNLKPHSTNGLPGNPASMEIRNERVDLVYKGERDSAGVTMMRDVSDDRSILVSYVMSREETGQIPFEKQAIIELGEKIRARIGPALFDDAECFRVQGTELHASSPWEAIGIFFGSVHIEETNDLMEAIGSVDVEALVRVRASHDWLSRRAEELVDVFEERFEVEFADTCFPDEGLLEEDDRHRAAEIMLNALLQISQLFGAREIVGLRVKRARAPSPR